MKSSAPAGHHGSCFARISRIESLSCLLAIAGCCHAAGVDPGSTNSVAGASPLKVDAMTIVPATNPPSAFQLGVITVYGQAPQASEVLSATATVEEIRKFERRDLSDALTLMPGVTPNHVVNSTGLRNEAGVAVRGFDLRQVPVFIDGIPVYVPYDGYVDLRRFTVYDAAQVSVSKGFGSVLYGPNTLGGAINVVTRQPREKFEMDALAGVFSGDGREFSLNLGSRQETYYVQAGASYLERDHFRLSDDFRSVRVTEDGGQRENSYRTDWKGSFKIGWTPKGDDEYAIGYLYQGGEKGNPPYAGTNAPVPVRFWRWPEWDKQSVYFISKTQLGRASYVKPRLFFDQFLNTLESYDNATYTTQNLPRSFTSIYDDYAWGGSLEFGTELIPRNTLKTALHYKLDHHDGHNVGARHEIFEDQTCSFGIEDTFEITDKLSLVGGLSYDVREILEARDSTGVVYPDGDFDAMNPQVGAFYALPRSGQLHATVSRKSRFPTVKDRYSSGLGTAVPNSNLQPEIATHYEFGYAGTLVTNLSFQLNLFFSRIEDTIQRVPAGPGLFQLQNTGESEHRGVEIAARYNHADRLRLGWNYLFLERENISNPALRLTGTPKHHVFGYAEFIPVEWLSLIPSVEYSSRRYAPAHPTATTGDVDSFFLAHGKVSIRLAKGFTLNAGVNNIFDKNYQLVEGFPEEGRNWFANASYRF